MSIQRTSFYTLAPLLLVLIIDVMGFGLVLPVLGPICMNTQNGILPASADLLVRDLLYGTTMGLFSLFAFFGGPFLGDLSDRFGRKKVLTLCLLGTSIGFLLSGLGIIYSSIAVLFLGRIVSGFSAGGQAISQAAIIDLSTDDNKAKNLSLMSFATCLGFMIGPIMGGYFSNPHLSPHFSYSTPFLVAAFFGLINAIALLFTFKEAHFVKSKKLISLRKGLTMFLGAFKQKELRVLSIVALLIELSWALYLQSMPLYLTQTYHYSSVEIGHFMGFISFVLSCAMLFIIRIMLNRSSVERVAFLSLVLAAGGMLLATLFPFESMQWVSVIPIALGFAINWPCMLTLFSNAVDKESQGWAMGVFSAITSASWLVMGIMTGFLAYLGTIWPFLVETLLAAAGGYAMFIYNKNKKIHHQAHHQP